MCIKISRKILLFLQYPLTIGENDIFYGLFRSKQSRNAYKWSFVATHCQCVAIFFRI